MYRVMCLRRKGKEACKVNKTDRKIACDLSM